MQDSNPSIDGIANLPTEILLHILAPFSTRLLLPLAGVSRRFHDLIIRIVHTRLLLAASLKEHKLILECYHPSSKNTEPYLFCDYLGTPGLSNDKEGEGSAYTLGDGIGHLGRLGGLYSRFRPIRPEAEQRVFRSHPAGDVPGRPDSSTMFGNQPSRVDEATLCHEALVSHSVNLDSHELFSQLCVVTNLVQLGPRRGVFFSFVNVADGVVRIWREWLADRARKDGKELSEIDSSDQCGRVSDDAHLEARTLWVDSRKNVGVRVRIKEREWRRDAPILLHRNEDPAVSYAMEYEELLIRTNHLLLAVERTLLEQNNASGKAMIFGSFASRNTT